MTDSKQNVAPQVFSENDYRAALASFDAAICDACAVSQAQAGRPSPQHIAYASYVFTRLCAHGVSMVRAAPYSRWVKADNEHWDFSAVASHARAILEGYLTFKYLTEPASNDIELNARMNVMHLNEVTRRAELQRDIGASESTIDLFARQREEIQEILMGNEYFKSLPPSVQKTCLSGQKMMMLSRDQLFGLVIEENQTHFNAVYDLWSQHTHILPLSFYRMEPNGRGTSMENDTDRSYIGFTLQMCSEILTVATDALVQVFPDTSTVRQGVNSIFSPGPHSNRPRSTSSIKTRSVEKTAPPLKPKVLAAALARIWDEEPPDK